VGDDFGTPGVKEYAVSLDTTEEALRFNRRLENAFISADAHGGTARPGQLHVAIIGAGATGSELSALLVQSVREIVAYGIDGVDPQRDVRIILIEGANRILPTLSERISEATLKQLSALGVEIHTGARVSEVTGEGVRLANGEFLPASLVVWSAGIKAPAFLRDLDGLETNRHNQLVVTETLQTTRDPNIFAIGDCGACPWQSHTTPVPARAQAAHQEASHLSRQIGHRIGGKPLQPYAYRDFGSLISLGEYRTVGNIMGLPVARNFFVDGYFARLMYRSLYLMHEIALCGWRKTLLETLARRLSQPSRPPVKLH
jgi:NADH dehydrogenase